jgi:hypothetical protein
MQKAHITGPKICVWASSIFFSKRWIKPRADKKKKEKKEADIIGGH